MRLGTLTWRAVWVFAALGVGASLTWAFRTEVFALLLAPAHGSLSETGKPIFTGPTEMFSLVIGMAVKGGVIAAVPMLTYQVYAVARPWLSRSQRRTLCLFLFLMAACWLGGTAFAYFVLLPTGLNFLLNFGTDIATPMIRITEYMALAMALLFWAGLIFELPVVMVLLARLKVVTHSQLTRLRRYVPIAALILGMIITPTPDPLNQAMVAGPLIALYEVGMFLVRYGMNPLRWPILQNVWAVVAAVILTSMWIAVVALIGLARALWYFVVLARYGKVTSREQAALRERMEVSLVQPYFVWLRRLGVEVDPSW